ncbi:MAG: hypothetical protein M0P31_05695 [Solirubrobacteraceae bacterium]|nr:hypothetical protein [Solirubrobacteraceae bacterium]
MLFDLRAPGRKRFIQVTYVFLALLLVGGIFVGVGTGLPSFLDTQTGGSDLVEQQEDRLEDAEKAATASPRDERVLASLASARYDVAISRTGEDATQISEETKQGLRSAADAWKRYLALEPKQPNVDVARKMTTAFQPGYLNQTGDWADAQAIVTQAAAEEAEQAGRRPPVASYLQLVQAQVAAGRKRQAKITGETAIAAAPAGQRKAIEEQIKQLESGDVPTGGTAATNPEEPRTVDLGD